MRSVLVVVALTCAACANAGDGDDLVSPPSTVPGPLSARIELDATTVAAGDNVTGRVIVVNNTGNTVRVAGCGSPFQVALSNEDYKPELAWQDCLEDFLVPMGESSYPVSIFTFDISADSEGNPHQPLEPGEYQANTYQRHPFVPDAEPVEVEVID